MMIENLLISSISEAVFDNKKFPKLPLVASRYWNLYDTVILIIVFSNRFSFSLSSDSIDNIHRYFYIKF